MKSFNNSQNFAIISLIASLNRNACLKKNISLSIINLNKLANLNFY